LGNVVYLRPEQVYFEFRSFFSRPLSFWLFYYFLNGMILLSYGNNCWFGVYI
jgi:hypothetical protein